ncbi:unnamed protein product [Ambrosiozyma monospora]|uniref:Unnamed protein product n=1 Tax=Ambrosiozyma monospora TaxID=43982 RepID=A0ACB5T6T6_AMBMO|nr:unnamed protein product [Ambrosiozyma monospora]
MFKLQDLNPAFKQPASLLNNNSLNNNNTTNTINGVPIGLANIPIPTPGPMSTGPSSALTQPQRLQSIGSLPIPPPTSSGTHYGPSDANPLSSLDPQPTLTNYYKFTSVYKINYYFYQIQDIPPADQQSSSNNHGKDERDRSSPQQQIHAYDILIKEKLQKDYNIKDVISFVAKKEICVFQIEGREVAIAEQQSNPHSSTGANGQPQSQQHQPRHPQQQSQQQSQQQTNTASQSSVGFNRLKDAIDNIILENKLHLKLISASRYDAETVFRPNLQNQQEQQQHMPPGMVKRPINITYLSFLRAVKRYVSLHLTGLLTWVMALEMGTVPVQQVDQAMETVVDQERSNRGS